MNYSAFAPNGFVYDGVSSRDDGAVVHSYKNQVGFVVRCVVMPGQDEADAFHLFNMTYCHAPQLVRPVL